MSVVANSVVFIGDEPADRDPERVYARLVAALGVCLWRYAEREDVIVAGAVPNECEGAGPVGSVVPLRVSARPGQTVRDLVIAVQQAFAEAVGSATVPLGERDDRPGLRPTPSDVSWAGAVVVLAGFNDRLAMAPGAADLMVKGEISHGQLGASITYDPQLFAAATIETFVAQLRRVLVWQRAHFDRRLDELTPNLGRGTPSGDRRVQCDRCARST